MMKKEYNAMFERLAPQKSDEELLRAVFEGKAEMSVKRKRKRRAVLIPAIAAAALCATTVGVSAANNWDLRAAIKSLFKTSEKNGESGLQLKYDIDGIGSKKLDGQFERDGYKIDLVGVVAEKHTSFLLYDLTIEEGHVFKNEITEHTYSTEDKAWLAVWENAESYSKLLYDYLFNNRLPNGLYDFEKFNVMHPGNNTDILLEQEGNVYHCAHRYDIKPLSLDGNELSFDLNGLYLVINNDGRFFEMGVCDTVTINFDFIKDSEDVLIEVNKPFTFDGETYMLDKVELTPLSVYLRIYIKSEDTGEYADNSIQINNYGDNIRKIHDNVKLQFKDGSITDGEVLFRNKSVSCGVEYGNGVYSSNLHLMWKYPVNVADIESVTIGDTTFTLN